MKKIIWITGIVILLVVAGFFFFNGNKGFTGNIINSAVNNTKEFTINAFRFGYNPNTITVNQGDKVKIIINNADSSHGMVIPDLGLSGVDSIEFTAENKGEYAWYCYIPCGPGHAEMQGKLIIK